MPFDIEAEDRRTLNRNCVNILMERLSGKI